MDGHSYETGYKKPPKETRFKKGQSGNPSGRPKTVATPLWNTIGEELLRKYPFIEAGRKSKANPVQLAIRQMCAKAAKGDMKAIQELLKIKHAYDRMYLPPPPPLPPDIYAVGFEGGAPEDDVIMELPREPLPINKGPLKEPW